MKKNLLFLLSLVILASHIHGMTTQTRRLTTIPRKTPAPSTVMYTKAYVSPSITDRFKQYYGQFKQWLWGPRKNEKVFINEANIIVERIKTGKSGYLDDFEYVLKKEKQEDVSIFLNELIKSPEGLFFVNNYVALIWQTYIKETVKKTGTPKTYQTRLDKISTWAKDNLIDILLTVPAVDNNFFLLPLVFLPDKKIEHAIKDNFVTIEKIPTGKLFLLLLKKTDPQLYQTIVSDTAFLSNVKSNISEEKNQLNTQE